MDFAQLPRPVTKYSPLAFVVVAAWCSPSLYSQSYSSYSGYGDYSGSSYSSSTFNNPAPVYLPPPPLVPVFFPPDPPPLSKMTRNTATHYGYRYDPSPELASYINEPFYPALAALFDHDKLSDRKRAALRQYREEKRALQHDLHTELIRVRTLEPAARNQALATLRIIQTPKIADLERRADDFRSDFLKSDYAWSSQREWQLGQSQRFPDTAREIASVMRAAAYFQSGLSPDQRVLLREIAIEIPTAAETAEAAAAAQPYVFFSPGPSRVFFPENVPSALASKIALYQTRRSELRKQLYDVVFHEDRAWFSLKRIMRLQALAKEQAPEFAVLEDLAEEIRRDLATVPALPPPDRLVSLPPVIEQRMIALYARQRELQKTLIGTADDLRIRYPKLNVSVTFGRDRATANVTRRNYKDSLEDSEKATAAMKEATEAFNGAIEALVADFKAIRVDLAAQLRATEPSQVNVALTEGARMAVAQSLSEAKDDYHAAVFEPGLSPGQRRILFDYAIEQCELPLPAGELQPRERRTQRIGRVDR